MPDVTTSRPPPPPGADPPGPASGAWGTPATPEAGARPLGLGIALIAVGSVWLLAVAGVDVPLRQVLPGALVAIGVVLLLPGTTRNVDGLVGFGLLIAAVTVVVVLFPMPASFVIGERDVVVTTLSELDERYAVGAGTLTIDLRDVPPGTGRARLTASVGMGELRILVPEHLELAGTARVGLGDVEVLGRYEDGVAPAIGLGGGDGDGAVLDLEAQVGLGTVEVAR